MMGECRNDIKRYISSADVKRKTVVPQEKFAMVMLCISRKDDGEHYLYSAEIRSVSEDVSKSIATLSVKTR